MMRLVGSLIVVVSLVLGAVSAITAYLPKLETIDPAATPLTLSAAAGLKPESKWAEPGVPEALLEPVIDGVPTQLTPDRLDTLYDGGVTRVRVKEFAFARWDGRYLFFVSVLGLLVGAFVLRVDAARRIETAMQAAGAHASAAPEHLLGQAEQDVLRLQRDLAETPNEQQRLARILEGVESLQHSQFADFVESRPALIGKLGAGGYAQVMDRFAAAERQFNRAWSAAADGVLEEAEACVDEGVLRLREAKARLV